MGYLPWGTTAIKLLLDPNDRPFVSRQQERRGPAAERRKREGKMKVIGHGPWDRAARRLMEDEEVQENEEEEKKEEEEEEDVQD